MRGERRIRYVGWGKINILSEEVDEAGRKADQAQAWARKAKWES